jgi:hypothetical protein
MMDSRYGTEGFVLGINRWGFKVLNETPFLNLNIISPIHSITNSLILSSPRPLAYSPARQCSGAAFLGFQSRALKPDTISPVRPLTRSFTHSLIHSFHPPHPSLRIQAAGTCQVRRNDFRPALQSRLEQQ